MRRPSQWPYKWIVAAVFTIGLSMDIPATTIVNVAIPRAQPYRGVMGVRYPDFALSDGVIKLRRWSLADLGCVGAPTVRSAHGHAFCPGTCLRPSPQASGPLGNIGACRSWRVDPIGGGYVVA